MVPASPAPGEPGPIARDRGPASAAGIGPIVAEVVARLGDHIVDVRHLAAEPEPALSPAAWLSIGGSAIVLGLALALAGLSATPPPPVDDTVETAEQPATPRGNSSLGLGALLILLGVVPAVVGATGRSVPRDRYLIGEGPEVQLPVCLPACPPGGSQRAGLPLVRTLERQIVLGLCPGMTGELHDGARTLALAELVAQGRSSYALPPGARCEVALAELRITIQAVEPAAFAPQRRPLDRLYLASNLGALALLAAALLLGEARPTGEQGPLELAEGRDLAVRYLRQLPAPPPPPPDLPPVPKDIPRVASKPAARPPPPPAEAPPELAVAVTSGPAATIPKGTRRGRPAEYDYARTAGFLDDENFANGAYAVAASAQEGLLSYDNAEDRQLWAAVLAAPVINRPFGGLELAETERGGGLHSDLPRPAKAPAKQVTIDMYAKKPGPSAEARALARRIVHIELEAPHVIGELSPQTVQEQLQQRSGDLSRCFKEAVGTADRVGTIILRLKLRGDGTMKQARVDFSGAQLGDIEPCLVRAASAWKLLAPTDRQPASIAASARFSAKSY